MNTTKLIVGVAIAMTVGSMILGHNEYNRGHLDAEKAAQTAIERERAAGAKIIAAMTERIDSLENVREVTAPAAERAVGALDTLVMHIPDTIIRERVVREVDTLVADLRTCDCLVKQQRVAIVQLRQQLLVSQQQQDATAERLQAAIRRRIPSRISIGISAGYGGTLSSGTLHTGPSILFGVHWRLR